MTTGIYLLLIAITVVSFLFDKWLDYLNDKAKSPTLPQEAEGIYDADRYATWLAYDKANGRLGAISSSISIVVSLLMLVMGWFGAIDIWLRQYIENDILLALAFFGLLGLGSSIVSLPFGIYSTFVIEEKFGFNKTTWKTFVFDMIKGGLLSLIIGAPLAAAVIWFYYELGDMFWIAAWVLMTVFTLFMTMFGASWIMPLFNKFTPLEEGELRDTIEAYCDKVGFQLTNLFVMDGSKRSGKSNAFFTGLGPKKKIVLFDTLIEQMTTKEIVAVLAHEIGHYKKQHTRQSMILSIAQSGIMLFLMGIFLRYDEVSMALGAQTGSFHVGILAFGIMFSPISTLVGIGMNVLSRKNEFEADDYARDTYEGDALASGLKKLTAENLSNLKPHPYVVFVSYSHPPVLSRLDNLKS